MPEKESHAIRNGVIATVVGGLILSIVPILREITLGVLAWLWSGIVWLFEKILSSYAIPGWLLIIILFFAFLGVAKACVHIRPKEQPKYLRYREDFIYGAKWRWQWVGNKLSDIWCFCPHCDGQLVYDDSSCRSFMEQSKTNFLCERCNNKVIATIPGGDQNYAVGAAEREVLRRIRTNEFVKALPS